MKNFKNLRELKEKFENLLENKTVKNCSDTQTKDILQNLYTNGSATITNDDASEEESSSSDQLMYLENDDFEVDCRKNVYEYSEEHLKKHQIGVKDKKNRETCCNWEDVIVGKSKNNPKIVNFRKRKSNHN